MQSAMTALSPDLLEQLAEATDLSDADRIDGVIGDIRTHNRQFAGLLAQLSEKFAYHEIISLTDNGGER